MYISLLFAGEKDIQHLVFVVVVALTRHFKRIFIFQKERNFIYLSDLLYIQINTFHFSSPRLFKDHLHPPTTVC